MKENNKLTTVDWIKLLGFLLVYFFFIKSKDVIINYPYWLLFTAFAIVLVIVAILQYREMQKEYSKTEKDDKPLFVVINGLKIAVIAYFVSGVILIPFNYYTIYNSKENALISEKCEITGISTYSKNRSVFYKFKGKTNVINGFKPIMENIKDNGKFKNYYFAAEVKKGICNTYILENWDIIQK
ncbi:hypothetical protein [Flavobacterium sp. SLB02]|uniref:hypothetical protein n=1 Tax=Flavobacterium sp. SLB02 TaxID=2665645 RepID=UPI0012A7ECFC|nr:hypothetical protein [Flavobacterium sp. SLB02]QGK73060.1 hypothetical protein GIY83_02950 [Flavobacterium sp. SLB02]